MSEDSLRLHGPKTGGTLIYPPVWYLNLVQLRLRAVDDKRYSSLGGMLGVGNADIQNNDDGPEDVQLFALAMEITPGICLNDYSYGEQAHILGLNVVEVRDYLRETFNEIGLQASATTLIIEDEAAVALDIARIVRQAGHQVCGTATRLDQAISMAARLEPELLLADVQLRDGLEAGLAAVREIGQAADSATVYVTAYPERVRDAEAAPIVVPKPFAPNEIKGAIWRALYRRRQAIAATA